MNLNNKNIQKSAPVPAQPVLAVMASRLQRHRSTKLRSSTAEEFMEPTENYEGLCHYYHHVVL